MSQVKITIEQFSLIVPKICFRDTSSDPEHWTDANPLWGHCAVVSLLAQDYFGGELVRASLENISEYSYPRSHYWNQLPDCSDADFTAEQYKVMPEFKNIEIYPRERVLSYPDTQRRYETLVERFRLL